MSVVWLLAGIQDPSSSQQNNLAGAKTTFPRVASKVYINGAGNAQDSLPIRCASVWKALKQKTQEYGTGGGGRKSPMSSVSYLLLQYQWGFGLGDAQGSEATVQGVFASWDTVLTLQAECILLQLWVA